MLTPPPTTLPIRRLTPRDHQVCADLSESRGWSREERKWSLLLAAGEAHGIDDPRGGLVAACALTRFDARQADGSGLGAIGMMLVAERYARQGVGRRLLGHVIDAVGTTPLALYATPQGRPLYETLGFKAIGRSETVSGHFNAPAAMEQKAGGPGPAIIVRPAVTDDLPAILQLDGEVFGADRSNLISRLPTFTDQMCLAESDSRITGYASAWPTPTARVIGPVIAQDSGTAQALITSLAAGGDRPVRTSVDVRHEPLLSWLREHGLTSTESDTVMVHGISELPGDRTRNFAPFTVATG